MGRRQKVGGVMSYRVGTSETRCHIRCSNGQEQDSLFWLASSVLSDASTLDYGFNVCSRAWREAGGEQFPPWPGRQQHPAELVTRPSWRVMAS